MATTLNDDYPKKNVELTDADLKAKAIAQFEAKQVVESNQTTQTNKFPTEIIQLPSKGKFYPEGHPLSNGTIEMKYMTAREEDILTNQSYIKQGVVLDKLFKSLIITPFDYNDLLIGDKVEEWTLKGAFISSATFGDLDWSTEDPLMIELTLKYDYAILQF